MFKFEFFFLYIIYHIFAWEISLFWTLCKKHLKYGKVQHFQRDGAILQQKGQGYASFGCREDPNHQGVHGR